MTTIHAREIQLTKMRLYHLCWILNWRWTVTIESVCRNHSTIRVFYSVVTGGAILNDVTAASVAKYGKNTNV